MSFVPPSEAEQDSIQLLKQQLYGDFPDLSGNSHFNNTTVLRFLRGHKGNQYNAKEALKKYIEWRKHEDVDNIHNRLHEFKRELDGKKALLGFRDLQGRPATYVYAHNHNAHDREIDELRKLSIWVLEMLRRESIPHEERFVVCLDLSKFTLRCMDYEAIKQQIYILQSHFPDTLESCFIIDAPFIFSACWRVIRPWLDPVTASKVQFIKKPELEKFFDVSTIPEDK
jgi:hypothetical protein